MSKLNTDFSDLDLQYKMINESVTFLEQEINKTYKEIEIAESNFDTEELKVLYHRLYFNIIKLNLELKNLERWKKESIILCQNQKSESLLKDMK